MQTQITLIAGLIEVDCDSFGVDCDLHNENFPCNNFLLTTVVINRKQTSILEELAGFQEAHSQ